MRLALLLLCAPAFAAEWRGELAGSRGKASPAVLTLKEDGRGSLALQSPPCRWTLASPKEHGGERTWRGAAPPSGPRCAESATLSCSEADGGLACTLDAGGLRRAGTLAAEKPAEPGWRKIPARVFWKLSPLSDVKKGAIAVRGVRVYRSDGKSKYAIATSNSLSVPVTLNGGIVFLDAAGEVVFHQRDDGTEYSELVAQAAPGLSEGAERSDLFQAVDISRIARAEIAISGAFIDEASRD